MKAVALSRVSFGWRLVVRGRYIQNELLSLSEFAHDSDVGVE